MVSVLKEQENFLRNAILTVDHSKEALQCFIEQHLKNNNQTFEDFLNKNQHDIYHLYYDSRCCQCGPGPLQRKKRILFVSQMDLLFDKKRQLSVHKTTRHSDFCCCYAKKSVTTAVLDLTLARCLLMNCCIDIFWYSCLDFKGVTFEQFLNSNKHMLYHLWKSNTKCCKCQPDFIFPCNAPLIIQSDWKTMFTSTLQPCENDRKRSASGAISICSFAATPSITVQQIQLELQNIIIQYCCSTRKSVEKLAELRNSTFGHMKKASMPCDVFNYFISEARDAIIDLTTVCEKEHDFRQKLQDLQDKPLDSRTFCQYEKFLLQTITYYEDIVKENEVLKDGMESLKNSNVELKETVEELYKLHTEYSNRQRLIDQTSAAIESNCKDKTYVELGAVKHCIEMLKNNNVVVLSGREGSGKSRNGLEILRQLKEKHPFFEVFKLTKLLCVSDILKYGVISVILFEDVFENEIPQLTSDKQILDSLFSYTSHSKVKLIFEMRNTVKDKLKKLLSTHKVFDGTVYVDLDSQTITEKENILTNYCCLNKIKIVENSDKSGSVDHVDGTVVLGREAISEIVRTCPFLGFAECCRIFTGDTTYTNLGSNFFKYPQKDLIYEIEKIRVQGSDSYRNGLKYVTLIYILTLGKSHENYLDYLQNRSKLVCLLVKKNIETQTFKDLFKTCYNSIKEVRIPDIIHVCEELTCRYLVYKEGTYYFQHQAIQESVLISYIKINPKTIIPMLSIDHMVDIVRLGNCFEQENEAIIEISNSYYDELTRQFVLLIKSCQIHKIYRLENSKLIKESDTDFIYLLIKCLKNESETLSKLSRKSADYVIHYLPLFLLAVTGNIYYNTQIKHQAKIKMLLSVGIADKILTLSVDPHISIACALVNNDASILKWLLANTDHFLIDMNEIVERVDFLPNLEIVSLLLENFNHKETNMTLLILRVCLEYDRQSYHQVGRIIDLVEKSLVDYQDVIIGLIGNDKVDSDLIDTEIILYLLKRINLGRLDLPKLVNLFCQIGCIEIMKWVLQNVHHGLFDREGLIDITIDSYEFISGYVSEGQGYIHIVELLLKTPGMKCINVNNLVKTAIRHHLYGVVEELIENYSTTFINKDIVIANAFIMWMNNDYEDYENDRYGSVEWKEFGIFINTYCSDYTELKTISEKACEVGKHNVVDALMDKIDTTSFFFTNILDQLLSQHFRGVLPCFDDGHGMLLRLLLPRVNYTLIDLNNVMNDLCRVGHLQAVLLLLANNPSYHFEMKNVMNKACYYGGLKLVKYLFKNYSGKDFDYKIAMIKASRNSKGKTIDVCKWLWANINRKVFDMRTALNNASRCNNSEFIVWTLKTVDMRSYDIEAALLNAIEHGISNTVQLLLDKLGHVTFDFQSAISLACRNRCNDFNITKLLYERADQSHLDVNAILSIACKCFKTDIVQWIIETCNKNNDIIKNIHKYLEMNHAITCILDIDDPGRKKKDMNNTKNKLLWLILKQTDLRTIDIFRVLTESCKMCWKNIFEYILVKVDRDTLNIGEIINVACRNGALNIVKWSLENIDFDLVDIDTVIIESCSYGWLECLIFIQKHCKTTVSNVHSAMHEACTYGRLPVADWLLQNFGYESFNLHLLLKEACRNGWIDIFRRILTNFPANRFDLQNSISEAVTNGQLEIVKWTMSMYGRDCVDVSSLSQITSVSVNEAVLEFLFQYYDPILLDIATVMTNACKHGWKNIAAFILDKDFNNLCDLSLAFNTACDNGELEIARLFLDKVDPHILTTVDKAMHSVAVKGWDEISILLLDKVEHNRLDIGKAFIEACRHGEVDVVQAILRKVDNNMLDVKTALNKACENRMHEELVLWVLENIDQEQLDLKTVKIQAVRQKWWKVQFALTKVDTEDLNEAERETETGFIVIS